MVFSSCLHRRDGGAKSASGLSLACHENSRALQEKYVFSIGKSIFDDKSNSIEILKNYYPHKILFETDDSGVSIEHIYEKASQILNVDKNKINSEVRSKLKTIFAENKI
jgi:Tat protein secretion system quality control protein TatD with DNase activity